MRSGARLLLLLVAVAALAAGCDEGEPAATSPTAVAPTSPPAPTGSTTPTQSASPTETASPTESTTPSPALEDGRHFGYIRSIDVASQVMVFDLAYFLTGEEANAASAEHGGEVPVPNDYYIVNDNPRLRTLPIAPDVEIWVIDWGHCCEPVRGEIQPFVDAFQTEHHRWDAMYQGAESQYWLTVEDGAVVRIEEQYLP